MTLRGTKYYFEKRSNYSFKIIKTRSEILPDRMIKLLLSVTNKAVISTLSQTLMTCEE